MAELGSVMRALLAIIQDGAEEVGLAGQICRVCIDGLHVDGASISLLTGTASRETLCVSDSTAACVEDLQYTLGEGPCIEAAVTGCAVLVPDIRDAARESRWPIFAAAVLEQTGVGALFALPLQLGVINLGVLDLYRTAPGPMCAAELRDALRGADTAALMLLDQSLVAGGREDHSWSSRAEVHQATGMVVVQLGIGVQAAFARLRGYAFSHEQLLGDVARDVVARRLRFTEKMD